VVFAAIGVLNELYQAGGFSWATLVVIIGYPLYFVAAQTPQAPISWAACGWTWR
jgi:EamA domain-containing membrane protein RarD